MVPNTIEELLRFEPPGPHVARYVTEDVEYHGQVVPAGSALLLMVAAGNRDERRFDDPDRFDIHREIGQSLTFGYGAHYCLGAALARIEGRVALDEVLNRWPEWESRSRSGPTGPDVDRARLGLDAGGGRMSRVAVVTGGASGVGRSIAEHLAAAGHAVAVLDLDGDAAATAADELAAERRQAIGCQVDVADRAAIESAYDAGPNGPRPDRDPRHQRRRLRVRPVPGHHRRGVAADPAT